MSWVLRKADVFLAAAAIAFAGTFASQGQPFVVQYLARTDAELAAARAHLADVRDGLRYRVMGDTVRGELEAEAATRVQSLDRAYNTALNANPLLRPIAVFRHGDREIVAETKRGFVPALPVSRGGIAFGIVGMVVGFLLYEAIKLPLVALAREPRRRRFRRRG